MNQTRFFSKVGFGSTAIFDDFSKELWKLIKIAKIHVQLTFNAFLSLISGHKWPNLEDRVNSFTTTISDWQKFKLEINYGNLILPRLTRFFWQGKNRVTWNSHYVIHSLAEKRSKKSHNTDILYYTTASNKSFCAP